MKTIAMIGLAALLVTGCATNNSGKTTKTICPQCHDTQSRFNDTNRYNDSGVDVSAFRDDRVHHSCPDCQSAFAALFKEGKFKHRCTVCEANGYACPLNHSDTKAGKTR